MSERRLTFYIVEDEGLLALDLEMIVEDAGHQVVGQAASLFDVEDEQETLTPDIAFVDIQLARNTSGIDVARLIRKKWPETLIFFITANPAKIPDDFAGGHGVIPKPFTKNGVLSAIRFIQEGVTDPPPVSVLPTSFTPAPGLLHSFHIV